MSQTDVICYRSGGVTCVSAGSEDEAMRELLGRVRLNYVQPSVSEQIQAEVFRRKNISNIYYNLLDSNKQFQNGMQLCDNNMLHPWPATMQVADPVYSAFVIHRMVDFTCRVGLRVVICEASVLKALTGPPLHLATRAGDDITHHVRSAVPAEHLV
jgi:hypothetical protein